MKNESDEYMEAVRTAPQRTEAMTEKLALLRRVAPSEMVETLVVRSLGLLDFCLKGGLSESDLPSALRVRANVPVSMEQFVVRLHEVETAVETIYMDAIIAGKMEG
jgi:hypothetical protein